MPHKNLDDRRKYGRELARRQREAAHNQRLVDRREAIERRPRWPEVDLAYAAGMFEGEGTATISGYTNHLGNPSSRCVICLTSTDRQIIDFFDERWPSTRIGTRHANPRHKIAWVWILHGERVLNFIADVGPYLRTDAERAKFKVVERAQWLRRKGNRDEAVKAELAALTVEIRQLNRRGAPVGPEVET